MSYRDNGDENGASEGDSYQGGDSEEEFSDAPPAKKKKSSAKKKVKKAKKEKKKSKYTDDSDEDDIVAEVRFPHRVTIYCLADTTGLSKASKGHLIKVLRCRQTQFAKMSLFEHI